MNYVTFLKTLPWPVVFGLIATQAIPYLSQLLTKKPGWLTGILTYVFAFLDALFVQLSNTSNLRAVDWKVIVGLSLMYTASAFLHHVVAIRASDAQAWLVNNGVTPAGTQRRARVAGDHGATTNVLIFVVLVVIIALVLGGTVNVWFFLLLLVLLLLFL